MKKEDIPQDKSPLDNHFPELCYAKNEKGEYDTCQSTGWDIKVSALEKAWDDIHERSREAKLAVEQGKRSPIFYYMIKNNMTIGLLASYMKMSWILVWLHLRPSFYKKIQTPVLQRYASVLNISLEELNNLQ